MLLQRHRIQDHSFGKFTLLYKFTGGANWRFLSASVILDAAGNIYGTTGNGGGSDAGVVYKITADGHESVIYSFTGGADGGTPLADLIRDSKGNLYGTTLEGGNLACQTDSRSGCGTVFRVDPTGKETVLHTFEGGIDRSDPIGGLVMDSAGNLYGAASRDGLYGAGQVFRIDSFRY